ncbi:MAG: DNA polymerase III subunit gamma/tau [Alphaproteobacteria bacterium]|nr:DNA polymerase III subunit gamma/tau [Alphaproteobacteria bacterium]
MAGNSQVLARKYRPQVFDDLIGQEALVRTITNAIKQNRLAQAYILTGIRGVGKTTSARIIAKGLNCIGEDGKGGMTPNPCGKCKHCLDIANDAHIDVIEIDAASNTGVDNVREIIEGAKYNPVSARYKIYIIDEVHMLSKQAFNALLKTLEEPPERVKFIFATTEIRKVPLTILSRCQRFDLKRIEPDTLTDYLEKICKKEKKNFSREVLYLIAKAGDGSVRDSLSLLDQAITQLPNNPSVEDVRQMLGIADKSVLLDLYKSVLNADMPKVFDLLKTQYQAGADALNLVQDMLDLTYKLTCLKVVPKTTFLDGFTENEQKTLKEISKAATMHALTANWQLLLKGIQEVRNADLPFQATEMLMIRMAYLSDIPGPEQLLTEVKKNVESAPVKSEITPPVLSEIATPGKADEQPAAPIFQNIKEVADLARNKGERMLAFNIENFVRPIEIKNNTITCVLAPNTPGTFSANLIKFLRDQTGSNWTLKTEKTGGQPSLKEQKEASKQQLIGKLKQDPTVAEIEKLFAGAKIEKVKPLTRSEGTSENFPEEEA